MNPFFSQIFRFDAGSSIRLLSSKIEDMALLSILPRQAILSPVLTYNVSVNAAAPSP